MQLKCQSFSAASVSNSAAEVAASTEEGSSEPIKRDADVPGTTASDWSVEEHRELERALARFPEGHFMRGERYMHVAAQLPNRTARDVALRIRWLERHGHITTREGTGRLFRQNSAPVELMHQPAPNLVASGVQLPAGLAFPPQTFPTRIGSMFGPAGSPSDEATATDATAPFAPNILLQLTGQDQHELDIENPAFTTFNNLLLNNYSLRDEIQKNMMSFKVSNNNQLLLNYKDNLLALVEEIRLLGERGHLVRMPDLPVSINTELADSFLNSSSFLTAPGLPVGLFPSVGTLPHTSPSPGGNVRGQPGYPPFR